MNETKFSIGRRALLGGAIATLSAPALLLRAARAEDEPIRIGFPTPLTGPFGAEAKDQVQCAELAVKQFNAAGGLKGRRAELLVRDDKLKPGEAATRTLELIEKDKVACIVGRAVGVGPARSQRSHQGTRRRLCVDQPVRCDHGHAGLRPHDVP